MPSNKATDSFRTKSKAGATETHTIDSLAERLLITVEAAHELISSGVLEPIDGDESGEKLAFHADDLDAIRDAVVSSTEEEVDQKCSDPKQKQFATCRALAILPMASRESAHRFAKGRANEIRLSKIAEHHDVYLSSEGKVVAITEKGKAPDHLEFGVGTDMLEGAIKWGGRLLKRPGATLGLLDRKLPGLAQAGKDAALVGGIGAVAGGIKNATDGDPNTGILGGMAQGAAIGGIAGGAGSFVGSRLSPSPAIQQQLDALQKKKLATAGRNWAGANI